MLETTDKDPYFPIKVIPGDESYVYVPKQKPSPPNGCRLSRHVRRRHNQVRVTSRPSTLFFGHEGFVHCEYAPPGQSITKEYYIKVLCQLRDTVRRKRLQSWARGDWWLCHDNVPAHSSVVVQASLEKTLHHPGRSVPATMTSAFSQMLKSLLKGSRFVNVMVTQYTRSVDSISLLTD